MLNLLNNPLFGIVISIAAYLMALRINKRVRWLHPLFVCAGSIITVLIIYDIPYEAYQAGGDVIAFWLGPATVALGVPLYKHRMIIRKHALAILSGVTIGSVVGILSVGLLIWLMGGSKELIVSMMPKSTTSPIAIEISRQLGGIPELSAVFAVITGLIGSMIGTGLLRICGIRGDVSIGIAMGLAGIAASVLFIPLYIFLY